MRHVLQVFMVDKGSDVEVVHDWSRTPSGVLLITYDTFARMTDSTNPQVSCCVPGLVRSISPCLSKFI
jgi:hypothetical protein